MVPIVFCIDTQTNEYYIKIKGLAKVSVEGDARSVLRLKMNVFFFKYYFYPLKYKFKEKKKNSGDRNMIEIIKKDGFRKGIRILKSFKVKKLLLDIDTGDCILNAKLFPVFAFLNYYVGNFSVNFENRNQMVLYIQNRPINIIKSFINI